MTSIDKVLTQSVDKILPSKENLARLMQQRKIILYLGIDPSNPQIHLGNAVALRKLRQFQDLGHKVVLLIGDFTGLIGDPTDKTAPRTKLSKRQISQNAKTYRRQAAKILKFEGPNPAEVKFNSHWLSKLTFEELIEISSHLTVQQLEEREMFVQRKKEGKPIHLHEFLYPLMQGYDSVAMEVDLEVGGTDQTFNMLVGRQLAKVLKKKEKYVLTVPILLGTDGQKMGKSTGNFIAIETPSSQMYGKIMSIKDSLIRHYFELTTDTDVNDLDFSLPPMELKKRLAFEIVKIYHGERETQNAQSEFERIYQKKELPKNLTVAHFTSGATISQFLIYNNLASSGTLAKSLINQGAVDVNGVTIRDPKYQLKDTEIVKIGKKKIVKAELSR